MAPLCHRALGLFLSGQALPLAWTVLASHSATACLDHYRSVLNVAATVLPPGSRVALLADRGFFDVQLLCLTRDLGWHFRLRLKFPFWVYRATKGRCKVRALMPAPGQASSFSCEWLTQQRFGPVHLALAHVQTTEGYEQCAIVSDEPIGSNSLVEYGLRFDIGENNLDDKSAGFHLESYEIRDAEALSRLCLILTVTTDYLVSTGTAVVEMDKRHLVDTHGHRGLSYFQIGWRWVKRALHLGERLLTSIWLSACPDLVPAMASKKQFYRLDLQLSGIEWL